MTRFSAPSWRWLSTLRATPIALLIATIAIWSLWMRYASDAPRVTQDVTPLVDARLAISRLSPPRSGAAPESEIRLPLHWDVQLEGASGAATVRMPFRLGEPSDPAPRGLLVERIGTAYEIVLNGHVLASAGALEERDHFYAKSPVHLLLPARFFVHGENELLFHLRADAGYRAGLSPPLLGSAEAIDALARRARIWRVDIPLAASTFSLFVGAFCLLLWLQQRDPLYAWAAAGEILWAVTVADTVIEQAPLPWPWWGLVLLLVRAAWSLSLYGIAEQVFARGPKLERIAVFATQASAPIVAAAMLLSQGTQPLLYWYALSLSIWLVVLVRLGIRLQRARNAERAVVWTALIMIFLANARDIWAARFSVAAYAESASAKYLAPLAGLALMWIVAQRFHAARESVVQMNATLTERIQQKAMELSSSFARLAEIERDRAVLSERQRILRDLHDGVGAHLATAVRQLEGGRASSAEVAHSLRDSLTQLKLSIDAISLPKGDVNALLASLRFRLDPRIASAGIALDWQVDALPVWETDEGRKENWMRELQFILLEAISNVLQHAKATRLTITARTSAGDEHGIEIEVIDDGVGPGLARGAGPRSMRERAVAIGASLEVGDDFETGRGTRVRIRLPPCRT